MRYFQHEIRKPPSIVNTVQKQATTPKTQQVPIGSNRPRNVAGICCIWCALPMMNEVEAPISWRYGKSQKRKFLFFTKQNNNGVESSTVSEHWLEKQDAKPLHTAHTTGYKDKPCIQAKKKTTMTTKACIHCGGKWPTAKKLCELCGHQMIAFKKKPSCVSAAQSSASISDA